MNTLAGPELHLPATSGRQYTIFSFDVFDTCITRSCAYPRDIFYKLGLKLAPEHLAGSEKEHFAKCFQAARIRAERRAYRKAKPPGSTTIYDIYAHFIPPVESRTRAAEIAGMEIEFERECIYAVPEIAERIRCLRAHGKRVIFISDMYLPASILVPILQDLGVMQSRDKLYVSCDTHLTKYSGAIFKHVLTEENINPSDMLHVGDNLRSDILMPKKFGIATQRYTAASLNSHEMRITHLNPYPNTDSSFLAAHSRQSRLLLCGVDDSAPQPMDSLIHSTIAPFLISYVAWVIEQATQSAIKRLYFVARDGEIMHKIASIWAQHSTNIELHYLYGSRKAWLTPSIIPGSVTWMKLVVTPRQSNSYSDLLSRVGLEPELQAEVMARLGIDHSRMRHPLDKRAAYAFMEDALSDKSVASIIFRAAENARGIVADYLQQEGLLDDTPWALVDAGWSLNCQAALKRIISSIKGSDYCPHGYYLAFARDRLGITEAGTAHSFIPGMGSLFSRRRVIIEHCFTASTHPTTQSYTPQSGHIAPVFGTEVRDAEELAYSKRLHQIVEASAKLACNDEHRRNNFLSCRNTIVRNAEDFISRPSALDAEAMRAFSVVADLRHIRMFSQPLCNPLGMKDIWSIAMSFIAKRKSFSTTSIMWLEGSAALSPIYIRISVKIMLWTDSLLGKLKSQ